MQHLAAKPPQPSKLYLLQAVLSQKAEGLLLWSLTLKEPGKLPQITMSLLKKGRLDGWMDGWMAFACHLQSRQIKAENYLKSLFPWGIHTKAHQNAL